MTDFMQNRISYSCDWCGKIHHIELDEKIRLDIEIDGEAFFIAGAYKGHDETAVVIDTTWFLQMAEYLGEDTESVENPIVCVPWEDIEAFSQMEKGHDDTTAYSA